MFGLDIAVKDPGIQPPFRRPLQRPSKLVELAALVVRQSFHWMDHEGVRVRVLPQRFDKRDVEAQRLAAGGGGFEDHVLAGQDAVDSILLVRVERLDA